MSLSDFRVDGSAPPAPKEKESLRFAKGWSVIAFDQSITATGWARLDSGKAGVILRDCGSIMCPPEGYPKSHEGSLLRTDVVALEMEEILRRSSVTVVIHELPAITKGRMARMARPESSLMTAVALRLLARRMGFEIVIVDNRHSKKVLTGSAESDKKQWHAAMERLPWTAEGKKPTNEGQRDAVCLGLTFLAEADENGEDDEP